MQILKLLATAALGLGLWMTAAAAETASEQLAYPSRHEFFATLLETLPGHWEGQFADGSYDEPTSEWRPTRVDYFATAGGTALVENYLGKDDSVIMTTVYHLDNNDIRATHFCGARNHPRMVSRGYDAESQTISLGFVDVANLKSANDYHSRNIELSLVDEDTVHVTFFGLEMGEENSRVFALQRAPEG